MKKITQQLAVICLLAISSALFSFTNGKGGEWYEVYVNQKLLLQHNILEKTTPAPISLQDIKSTDMIYVKYSHCGKMGTNRTLLVKDNQNKLVKQWNFNSGTVSSLTGEKMGISARELLDLKKSLGTVSLYYHADELSGSKLLASFR